MTRTFILATLVTLGAAAVATPLHAQGRGRDEVPPDHRPPPGMCRIWIDGVPASRQPEPTDCPTAIRRKPPNARVIFGDDVKGGDTKAGDAKGRDARPGDRKGDDPRTAEPRDEAPRGPLPPVRKLRDDDKSGSDKDKGKSKPTPRRKPSDLLSIIRPGVIGHD